MKRRLIVCCDGTWQGLDQPYPTNVVKMLQAIKPVDDQEIHQIVYYDEGLGTRQINTQGSMFGSIIDALTRLGGGAFGLGIDHKIQDCYHFLCLNYEPGDEIYLFGFSRGAYTARCLGGLIYNSGLLYRQYIRKTAEAYELYREKQNPDNAPQGKNAKKFRQDYGQEVPIKALCCWDTVASLGVPNFIHSLKLDQEFNERYRFYDDRVNRTIEKAIHAVAIDEIRKVFDVTHMESTRPGQVTQVWFPGIHGCVGGGSQEDQGLSDDALLWVMEEVEKLGLVLDTSGVEDGIKPNHNAPFDNTPKPPFDLDDPNIREVTGTFDDLHESVKKRWHDNPNYRPENLMKFKAELDAYTP